MSVQYVAVAESDLPESSCDEYQLEDDSTLQLSTLRVQYPTATGLRYRADTGALRTLKVQDGRILPPADETAWRNRVFYVVLPKGLPTNEEIPNGQAAVKRVREPSGEEAADSDGDGGAGSAAKRLATNSESAPPLVDLHVRGLAPDVTEEAIREAFSQFGELQSVDVKRKKNIENPREAFAFIRFRDRKVQREVALQRQHKVDGHNVNVQRADLKKYKDGEPLRLFVTKLVEDPENETLLRNYFGKYGKITDLYVPRKTFRGYCFITFELPDSVLDVLDDGEHQTLENGRPIIVTLATPRATQTTQQQQMRGPAGPLGRGLFPRPIGPPHRQQGLMPGPDYPSSFGRDMGPPRGFGGPPRGFAPPEPINPEVATAFCSLLQQMSNQFGGSQPPPMGSYDQPPMMQSHRMPPRSDRPPFPYRFGNGR